MGEGGGTFALVLALAQLDHAMVNPNLLDMPCRRAYRDIDCSSVGPDPVEDAHAAPATTIYDTGPPAQQVQLVACLDVAAQDAKGGPKDVG